MAKETYQRPKETYQRPKTRHINVRNRELLLYDAALVLKALGRADLCLGNLPIWQKRPTYMAKETCLYSKRDLPIWQKRPTCMAKKDLPI